MSIRLRLTLVYTFILSVIIISFGGAVYIISRETLLAEVDQSLQEIAAAVRDRSQAVTLRDLPIVVLSTDGLDMFQSASYFVTIVDENGRYVDSSTSLRGYNQLLDPSGLHQEPYYSMVMRHNSTLRVLTVPLAVTTPAGADIIGYVQVATLIDDYLLAMQRLRLTLLFTGIAAITLSLFVGVYASHGYLKPLDDIAAVALQITRADDLGRRLPDTGREDEIGHMTMALNMTLDRLEKLFRSQQRFLADVSHELRTPLTALQGNVDLMRRMGEADEESLAAMQEELARMTRLVGDLLFLARADAGGLPIQRQPVDFDTVFLDVYRQAQHLTDSVRIELVEVDQVRLLGDGDRLRQLLLNLVDNAIKYTPAGGKVSLALCKEDGMARVEVTDTGVGIPPEHLPLIFDRFYRVDEARTRIQGGSGLGLSISHWIAQAHGGRITVTSEVGKGTTFVLWLPVLPEARRVMPASTTETGAARRVLAAISSNRHDLP
ncbi:MAG: HAMP domain-containing protein [Anaerolineales bacterium]|nr:HAMP domain-containing protein [Anaerolineales bacterium]MCB8952035.1 HAMP domain-containing protein [Ardenticatenales bacterium]